MGFLCFSEAATSSEGIRFELAGWADSGAFAVHADTGAISRMSTPLDYESLARLQNDTTPTLCLTIRGTDVPGGGKPALSSSCEVAIEESDVNEPPQMPSKDDGHA